MSQSSNTLTLEILSGPLDGARITLDAGTDLTRTAGGPLGFPWDEELGEPQAAFEPDPEGWVVRSYPNTPHGTYVKRDGAWGLAGNAGLLQPGDTLRAHRTWLRVVPSQAE